LAIFHARQLQLFRASDFDAKFAGRDLDRQPTGTIDQPTGQMPSCAGVLTPSNGRRAANEPFFWRRILFVISDGSANDKSYRGEACNSLKALRHGFPSCGTNRVINAGREMLVRALRRPMLRPADLMPEDGLSPLKKLPRSVQQVFELNNRSPALAQPLTQQPFPL
jgi:hypothetical protein